jgi:hypothetical protein
MQNDLKPLEIGAGFLVIIFLAYLYKHYLNIDFYGALLGACVGLIYTSVIFAKDTLKAFSKIYGAQRPIHESIFITSFFIFTFFYPAADHLILSNVSESYKEYVLIFMVILFLVGGFLVSVIASSRLKKLN